MPPSTSKKRKLSSSVQTPDRRPDPPTLSTPESGLTTWSRSVRGMLSRLASGGAPDPANPVINGATPQPRSFLRNLISDIASQGPRAGEDISLLASFAETAIFDGGIADDRKYQLEQILQLAASLPVGSLALDELTGKLIKPLWNGILHPPLSYQGDEFKYRMADGSNNNILYPNLGKAGSYYARTVKPQTLTPGVLPDTGVIFDAIYARGEERREHPNKISSVLFYLATIIIHDIFRTDADYTKVQTSSYLDLAPLYGSSEKERDSIRTFSDGLLKPDAFCESRILGFPPGVTAIVVCFNRYHNYVAQQLKVINEGNRFKIPTSKSDKQGWIKLDNDLFQTARLVTCGLYINIILTDYVRTILNLQRSKSTWTLDPRKNFPDVFDPVGVPSGVGNAVSVEFNLIYRWHSAISLKDEKWTDDAYAKIFPGKNVAELEEQDFLTGIRTWFAQNVDRDPGKWELDLGRVKRTAGGAFDDKDLVRLLTEATEDVGGAFGPRNVPLAMKVVEMIGMQQARDWQVATLNEFRLFFNLEPHKEFSDITKNEEVAQSLKGLYGHPDYVELYPGLVAEDAKIPLEPGSGLCPGYTISRTILSDAVALTRGDRFYTVDNTPANLTNWGFNQIQTDPDVAGGHVIYNLLMRALPFWYRGNSVYAMFPLVVPNENRKILAKLGQEQDYGFDPPSYVPLPTTIKTWKGLTSVLADQEKFRVPWGDHTFYLTGHDYMLSGDGPEEAVQHSEISNAIYCPVNGLGEIQKFYEDLTTQLVTIGSEQLRENWYQLDAVRDVANKSHAIFVARLFHIPLIAPGDLPLGVTVDDLYLAMAVLFAYVFLDLDTARSFKLRKGAKDSTDQIAKLIKIVCEAVSVGKTLHLNSLFSMGTSGQLLGDYGVKLLQRLFDGGKSVDDVVYAIIPTAAAAVATQAQHFSQMLDVYFTKDYEHHWADIQKCAWSDDPKDFEKLKGYALEANRLAPAAFGLLRKANVETDIQDGRKKVHVKKDEQIYTDFIAGGLDATVFKNPKEININRDRSLYIHHGWGPHACVGRGITEVAMAAQLKVFAKLKDLRRAPGLSGEMKSTIPAPDPVSSHPQPNPGSIEVYMKEDWSDWWPFPTSMKMHHSGFFESQEEFLAGDTGLPNAQAAIRASAMSNGVAPKPSTA